METNINKKIKIEEVMDRREEVIIPIKIDRTIKKMIGVIEIIINQNNKMNKRIKIIIIKTKMIMIKKLEIKLKTGNIKKKSILLKIEFKIREEAEEKMIEMMK